jgi:hypothetical protein
MKNLLTAIALAKQEFKPIAQLGYNPYHKSKYATLESILNAISESFVKYGLCLMQPTVIKDGQTIVKTIIYHTESGEEIAGELLLPSNLEPQKVGSAISYYRRYSLCSLLAIVADEDDDGNGTIAKSKAISKTRLSSAVETQIMPIEHRVEPVTSEEAEGNRKARFLFETMKSVGLKADDVIQLAIEEYQTTDIRSLNWNQIKHMQKRMTE